MPITINHWYNQIAKSIAIIVRVISAKSKNRAHIKTELPLILICKQFHLS
jgi:hypothetical protein